jgi:hypothetical protein
VEKYQRELENAREHFALMFRDQVSKWEEESRLLHKQRARDRTDMEMLNKKLSDDVEGYRNHVVSLEEVVQTHSKLVLINTN